MLKRVPAVVQKTSRKKCNNLYFCTVHVVIFILFKPTHALFFKTHSHSHLKHYIFKNVCKTHH